MRSKWRGQGIGVTQGRRSGSAAWVLQDGSSAFLSTHSAPQRTKNLSISCSSFCSCFTTSRRSSGASMEVAGAGPGTGPGAGAAAAMAALRRQEVNLVIGCLKACSATDANARGRNKSGSHDGASSVQASMPPVSCEREEQGNVAVLALVDCAAWTQWRWVLRSPFASLQCPRHRAQFS